MIIVKTPVPLEGGIDTAFVTQVVANVMLDTITITVIIVTMLFATATIDWKGSMDWTNKCYNCIHNLHLIATIHFIQF